MKKFTQTVQTVREINEKELSNLQKSYREYFGAKLKKYNAESPADLTEEQKKDFFNEIKNDWEKGKGVKPEAKEKNEELANVKESESVVELNEKDIKNKEEFAKFAKDKLKKVHGDDYDEDKAQKLIDGLSKEAEESGDWGAAVGKLNKA